MVIGDMKKRGLAYYRYLNSVSWKCRRDKVLARDGYTCVWCGDTEFLEVHHLTYARAGYERMADLITLCRDCHRFAHAREK